jgi:hypothetical protein
VVSIIQKAKIFSPIRPHNSTNSLGWLALKCTSTVPVKHKRVRGSSAGGLPKTQIRDKGWSGGILCTIRTILLLCSPFRFFCCNSSIHSNPSSSPLASAARCDAHAMLLCHTKLCHAMPCYAMLCHVMLCGVMYIRSAETLPSDGNRKEEIISPS